MVKFKGKIYKIGINPVVDPPEKVLKKIFEQAGRSSGPITVRGLLNGTKFIQTLVKYGGVWRLYINGPMLKKSGSALGDTVNIELEFDPTPREPATRPNSDLLSTKTKKRRWNLKNYHLRVEGR